MKATGVLYQNLFEQMMSIPWPSRHTRDKAFAFVHAFMRKRQMENTHTNEYTDMAYVYLLQKLGSKYREIFRPLLDSGILQSTRSYRVGYYDREGQYIKGQCLSYRLNPELMDDEIIKVTYDTERTKQRCRDHVTMKSKQLMRQLRIPKMTSRQLINFVKTSLTEERIRKMLKVDEEITDEVVRLKTQIYYAADEKKGQEKSKQNQDKEHRGTSKRKARKYQVQHLRRSTIKTKTRSLIKDGKFCYIDHLDTFIKRKRRHLVRSYCDQLLRIKHRNVYADRNETNLRLDSNLTNLKSDFVALLHIDGHRLGQIDLKNSQFRFFVMLLEQAEREILFGGEQQDFPASEFSTEIAAKQNFILKRKEEGKVEGKQVTLLSILFRQHCTINDASGRSLSSDYKLFRRLVKTGRLYEHIQQVFWTETGQEITRARAKQIMFEISFSSHRHWPETKRIVAQAFPTIVALMDGFKKGMIHAYTEADYSADEARDKGNASFAVTLQQIESLVFIDEILDKCHKSGIKALSKHDSILFRQCDRSYVAAIVIKILNKVFGKFSYSLDVDGQVFELRPKKQPRFMRKAFEMMHNLFSKANRANAPPAVDAKQLLDEAQTHKDYNYKTVPAYAYNARAPRMPAPGTKPLKNKRLEALRKKWYGG